MGGVWTGGVWVARVGVAAADGNGGCAETERPLLRGQGTGGGAGGGREETCMRFEENAWVVLPKHAVVLGTCLRPGCSWLYHGHTYVLFCMLVWSWWFGAVFDSELLCWSGFRAPVLVWVQSSRAGLVSELPCWSGFRAPVLSSRAGLGSELRCYVGSRERPRVPVFLEIPQNARDSSRFHEVPRGSTGFSVPPTRSTVFATRLDNAACV
eukprot:360872-Chlamydomonas_euryale.AAC.3